MRYYFNLFISFALCCLIACRDEEEKFENIEFETTGLILSPPIGSCYHGEVNTFGGDIIITAKGKNVNNGFLSLVQYGDSIYVVTEFDRIKPLPCTICKKSWGHIELLSKSPHSIRLVFNENQTSNSIDFFFTFGGGYTTSTILLTQLSIDK